MWCVVLLTSSQVNAFTISLESEDLESGWEQVKNSKITQSASTLLDEIWYELQTFVRNWLDDISQYTIVSPEEEQVSSIPRQPLILRYASLEGEQYFSDIADDTHKDAIVILAQYDIVNSKAPKFYPQNYVRLHECVKMLLRSCEVKLGKQFSAQHISSLSHAPEHYQLVDSMGMLEWIAEKENFERLLSSEEYTLLVRNFSQLYVDLEVKEATWETISRSDMSALLVESFDLSEVVPADKNIEILINHTMYPFSDVRKWIVSRAGFAQFLAQVHASQYGNNLAASMGKQVYVDVNYDQGNYMYYLQSKGLIDYLSETRRWKNYFSPEQEITKHEVYEILSDAFGHTFTYTVADADQQTISYEELSALFVEIISREPVKKLVASSSTSSGLWSAVLDLFQ